MGSEVPKSVGQRRKRDVGVLYVLGVMIADTVVSVVMTETGIVEGFLASSPIRPGLVC